MSTNNQTVTSEETSKPFRPTRALVVEQEWSEKGMGDGYWMLLYPGFQIDGVHAIHESSKTAAYRRVRDVRPCKCVDCAAKASLVESAP